MILIALTVAAASAAGVLVHRRHPARAGGWAQALLRVMLGVLVPPVVFFNLARLELTADVGAGIALAWAVVLAVGVLGHVLGTRVLRLERPQTGSLMVASVHGNTGYLGLPLVAALLGPDALDEAVAFDVLVMTPLFLIGLFGIGAAYGTEGGATLGGRVRAFLTRNPPLWAAVAALLAPDGLAPDVLVDASRVLVFALLPLGFFVVGITLADERLQLPPPLSRRVAAALGLRLVAAPALLLAVAAPLIDLPGAYLILMAMPSGLNGLMVAHAYGLDVGFSASAITWSTGIVVVAGVVGEGVAG